MSRSELHPVFILIDYVWALLKTNYGDAWTLANEHPTIPPTGIIPIIPLGDEPKISEHYPRAIYNYTTNPVARDFHIARGTAVFAIKSKNYRQLTRSLNIIQHGLERYDETARDINEFSQNFSVPSDDGPTYPYRGMSFASVEMDLVSGGTPSDTEGGPMVGAISITWQATFDWDVDTSV